MDLVSIIVPVYNAEEYIVACIESIQKQTYQNIEILLVNDGSKDLSPAICDRYQQKDNRIKVFHRSNHGVSSTRNFGIENASGDYIQFVDADDTLEPETIEENLKYAKETNADLVFFSFRYHILDENLIKDNAFTQNFAGNAEEFFEKYFITLIDRELINPPWNKFISRNLIQNGNIRFNENFSICEDMAFSTELLNASKRIAFNHKMYYNYNLKSTGSLVFRFHENYFEALSYYYQKAMEYCDRFQNREKAIRKLDTSFSNLSIMYLKQISCYESWNKQQKYERIQDILRDDNLKKALRNADLNKKKRIIHFLMKHNWYSLIYGMYRLETKIVGH